MDRAEVKMNSSTASVAMGTTQLAILLTAVVGLANEEPTTATIISELSTDNSNVLDNVIHYAQVGALSAVSSIGVIANCLVFVLFYRRPAMRTFSNRFVLNLSFSHLLHFVFVQVPTLLSYLTYNWALGRTPCLGSAVLSTILNISSVLSLLLIALDRNCAVNSPLHYSMTVTKKRTGVLITGLWVLSITVAIPPLFNFVSVRYRLKWHTCVIRWVAGDPYSIVYATVLVLLGFVIPLLTTSFVYCSMFQAARMNSERARKHSLNSSLGEVTAPDNVVKTPQTCTPKKKFRRMSSGSSQSSFFGDEWKAVRTGIFVVSTFTLCWFPYFFVLYTDAFISIDELIPDYAMFLVLLCSFSASAINPYLYVFRNKATRKEIKKLLNCFRTEKRKNIYKKNQQCEGKIPSNNPCILTASLVSETSEKVKTLPSLYQDIGGHWQGFSTSEERSRDDLDDAASSISDDYLDKESREAGRRKSCGSVNVHAIYSNNFSRSCLPRNISTNSLSLQTHKLLLFRLRSQLNRDSTSSDTTENYSMSLDSEPPEKESLPSKSTSTTKYPSIALEEEKDQRSTFGRLCRGGSLNEGSVMVGQRSNLSYVGSTKRQSFIHSHIKNRKSSETTLTSSTNSEILEPTIYIENNEKESRPKLVRQEETSE